MKEIINHYYGISENKYDIKNNLKLVKNFYNISIDHSSDILSQYKLTKSRNQIRL